MSDALANATSVPVQAQMLDKSKEKESISIAKNADQKRCLSKSDAVRITLFVLGIIAIAAAFTLHFGFEQPNTITFPLWIGGGLLMLPYLIHLAKGCKSLTPSATVTSKPVQEDVATKAEAKPAAKPVKQKTANEIAFDEHIEEFLQEDGTLREGVFTEAFLASVVSDSSSRRQFGIYKVNIMYEAVRQRNLAAVKRINAVCPQAKTARNEITTQGVIKQGTPDTRLNTAIALASYLHDKDKADKPQKDRDPVLETILTTLMS